MDQLIQTSSQHQHQNFFMRPFKFVPATDPVSAIRKVSAGNGSKYLAGGTNLLDLMKEDVERPSELVDVSKLKFTGISMLADGHLSIGAMAKNSDTANHPLVRQHYPLLSQAILAGASAQIRNMASNGGNLLQRTRCSYFYDVSMPCNKRENGTGCSAMEGINRMHAIFGWSEKCIAVFPSDMAVALSALDAKVQVQTASGDKRMIDMKDFHRLPGENPEKDNTLNPGELITAITIPKNKYAANSYYLKVRDRASYAFALVSVAAALEMEGNKIVKATISMGGVAHKPWRAFAAEEMLAGKNAADTLFEDAAASEMKSARVLEYNSYKQELGKRAIVRALKMALNYNTAKP
jgi:xanthine dehydrogenase YagS FAD-binding subunit